MGMRMRGTLQTLTFLAMLTAAHGLASTGNIVSNGSFEQGSSNWLLFGQSGGAQFTLTTNAIDGVLAMQVANRTNLSHHVTQNITTNLLSEGAGGYFGIEFSVNMAAPGSVRATMQVVDDAGIRTLILAEKMIADAVGRWVTVRGGRTITWQGTLALASLRFEIGQITERFYPPAILDRIRIVRDTDRDGLTDDVDPAPGSADANTNQIPDGWESLFHLPDAIGATDLDGDGFSNVQEYWAATDPTNALSRPAQPANTNATAEARALLSYLATLPSLSTQRVLVGQVVTDTATDYANQVMALEQETGRWPAMLGVVYDMINGPINHAVITPHATNYWNAGGLVHIQWNPDNPWNRGFSGNTNNVDFPALFTPGSPSHTNYLATLDEVAAGLRQLGEAGMTVLFRPLCECNSGQNWFQRRARDEYISLYRWTFDYLAKSQGLNHVLWVYDALDGPHHQVPVTYYYPGNDVVDVFGVNVYDDDWTLPFDLDRLSRDYPKPLAIPEGGPSAILDGTFTNLTYITAISNNFPRLSYFGIYNSFSNTVAKLYGLVDNIGASNLFDHPWIVTREGLAWRNHLGPFGGWQLQQFGTNANMSAIAGDMADPDHDGSLNLFEYAIGSDPQSLSGSSLIPHACGVSFSRYLTATDITFNVETICDLRFTNWVIIAERLAGQQWSSVLGTVVTDANDGNVVVDQSTTNPAAFFRLKVLHP